MLWSELNRSRGGLIQIFRAACKLMKKGGSFLSGECAMAKALLRVFLECMHGILGGNIQ